MFFFLTKQEKINENKMQQGKNIHFKDCIVQNFK